MILKISEFHRLKIPSLLMMKTRNEPIITLDVFGEKLAVSQDDGVSVSHASVRGEQTNVGFGAWME